MNNTESLTISLLNYNGEKNMKNKWLLKVFKL